MFDKVEYRKKYYKKNKSQIDKKNRAWAKRNPEKATEHRKRSYRKHRAKRIKNARRWELENPEKVATMKVRYLPIRKFVSIRHKFKRYGLTIDDYVRLLDKQGGECSICNLSIELSISRYKRALDVDHDHATGKVRGLLCMRCNLGLGSFSDNINKLKNAVKYLQ